MYFQNVKRKLCGRNRSNSRRIILITSLVWVIVGIILFVRYFACIGKVGWRYKNSAAYNIEIPVTQKRVYQSMVYGSETIVQKYAFNNGSSNTTKSRFVGEIGHGFAPGGISATYRSTSLRIWHPASTIKEHYDKPGEMGKPVKIPPEMKELAQEKFKENEFNLLVSDMISLNRSLRDVRHENCKTKQYPSKLPTTSVVIVFHNEAWSTLLRTIWSVINRSPRALLKEIILVDDASDRDYLGKKLEDYVADLPVHTFVLRTQTRSGLIRARLLGAKHVTGEVITFLDAHCECAEEWLEPLLSRIVQNRRTVVCPIIDVISDETFEYLVAGDYVWGGFDWTLTFRWHRVSQREMERRNFDRTAPLRTPTMAGGLFSIDKEYFYEIGSYDEGMDIWGSENLEMSFRVWQCGGILEIIPCSRVGHVFREKSPYTFPGGVTKILYGNAARVAEVWMDEWRDFYYGVSTDASKNLAGDVEARQALRKRLKCKPFRWYLENIYPESSMPLNYYYLGRIRNLETNTCLDTMYRKYGEKIAIHNCGSFGKNQLFLYTKHYQILSDNLCLFSSAALGPVNMTRCHNMRSNQKWVYDAKGKFIRHTSTGNCLQRPSLEDPTTPLLCPCNYSKGQQWLFESTFKWQPH